MGKFHLKKPDFRHWTDNWLYKVAALLLAIAVWLYVGTNVNPNLSVEKYYYVQLDTVGLAEDLVLASDLDVVKIRLSGSGTVLSAMSNSELFAYVNVTGLGEGEYTGNVEVSLPEGVQLVSVEPTTESFVLAAKEQRQLDVSVRISGSAPEGMMLLDPVVSPAEVLVSGPENRLDQISQVLVEAVLPENLTENYSQQLPLRILNSAGKDISDWFSISPASVHVLIPVVSEQPEKIVPISASLQGEPADGYRISRVVISPATATVYGNYDAIDAVDYIYTENVDVSGIRANGSYRSALVLPDGLESDVTEPVLVAVYVEATSQLTLSAVPVMAFNVPGGMTAEFSPATLDLVVTGSEERLAALKSGDVTVYYNLNSLLPSSGEAQIAPGTYEVTPSISLPMGVSCVSGLPDVLRLTLSEAAE